LDAILEAAGDTIVGCNADGGEAVGQSLDIIILERLRTRHWEGFNKMVATGQGRYPEGHLPSAPRAP